LQARLEKQDLRLLVPWEEVTLESVSFYLPERPHRLLLNGTSVAFTWQEETSRAYLSLRK